LIALLDSATGAAVKRLYSDAGVNNDRISELTAAGFFAATVANAEPGSDGEWKPTSVTFSTTQKCTLRCKYCYAEGGRLDDLDIPWPMAKASLDLIVKNGLETGRSPDVNFLGEGEATASWSEFTTAIEYFQQLCEPHGFVPYVELSTNGVFPASRIEYIAKNCSSVTFSIDGVADIHNANRVLPNGKGSFEHVVRNLRAFDDLGKEYHIRSTVSSTAVGRMDEFVAFVGEELKCKHIHFEPIFDVTKVTRLKGEIIHPDGEAFVQGFRAARQIAARHGIELYYSGSDLNTRHAFCGASAARNFLVTSRGIVTACNEVLQPWDPRASLFQYGRWSSEHASFEVDSSKISKLGHLQVADMPKCKGCIAKYNCAGDCYARSAGMFGDPWTAEYTYRCYITRELLKDNLLYALLASELGMLASGAPTACAFAG
jgi:uncharacterized protein